MCGIVGYIGPREAYPVLMKGLKRLEYRGYDSAGIALLNGGMQVFKCQGRVADLEAHVNGSAIDANIGMGHTRWATHGAPSDQNAHPHQSMGGRFVVIHNGIIENYTELKNRLIERGYAFKSQTDTEVLANLIEEVYQSAEPAISAFEATRLALRKVVGAFGIVVMSNDAPDQMIVARRSSPIVIGLGEGEYFVASDATPIVEYTKNVVYLKDDEIAILRPDEFTIKTIGNEPRAPEVQQLEMQLESIEKGGYPHFMMKEIFEQPRSVEDSMRGRVDAEREQITLGGLEPVMERLTQAKRIIIIACGTSWHAGIVGEYMIENLARVPVEVEYASEFRYRNPIIDSDDVIIAISQSGETADTLAAIKIAKERGALVLGICNVVGASIPRETHAGVYTHAGPEIGVASTKAFTAQVTVLALIAMRLGSYHGTINEHRRSELIHGLKAIPEMIDQILQQLATPIRELSERFKAALNFLYLGRGYNFPVALEGALKLKEISYIHAEGYPAAEMKHGPIALIDENMPVVFIAPKDTSYDKIVSNIQEVKARHGVVIAVVSEGDDTIPELADYTFEIPAIEEALLPLLTVIPLQLLSYYIAVLRGCDVDKPRNLAKSVTVE
jgi:glucosamine--fructose-6-phosphate aminotransferase (isomerizing)